MTKTNKRYTREEMESFLGARALVEARGDYLLCALEVHGPRSRNPDPSFVSKEREGYDLAVKAYEQNVPEDVRANFSPLSELKSIRLIRIIE